MTARASSPRPYHRRHPVARFFRIGGIKVGGIERTLWGFMSFWNGIGKEPTFACFDRLAPVDEHGQLRVELLDEGDIIVEPGIIYKKMSPLVITGKMRDEHERAMKKWKPKVDIVYEKDTSQSPIDAGIINLTGRENLNG